MTEEDQGAPADSGPNGTRTEPPQWTNGTECASPPCYADDADPVYMGYLGNDEVLWLLNLLLESERAGARAIGEMCADVADQKTRILLHGVSKDEARYCLMLARHVERLGGEPSRATGPFYAKLLGRRTLSERIALLNAGQGWVVRKLEATLPRIAEDRLRADLTEMLDGHRRNVDLCTDLAR